MTLTPFAHGMQTMTPVLFFSLLLQLPFWGFQLPFWGDFDWPAQNKLNQTCPGPSHYKLPGVHLSSYISITLHSICSQNLAQHFCIFFLIIPGAQLDTKCLLHHKPPAVCRFAGEGIEQSLQTFWYCPCSSRSPSARWGPDPDLFCM